MARLSKKREREMMDRTNHAKISLVLGLEHIPEAFIVIPLKKAPVKKRKVS